jgi:hypothetical protein
MGDKVVFNRDNKFDLQLSAALVNERRLADVFEIRQSGERSGIAATEADYWVHELKRDGETLVYLMFPLARLKQLAREAYAQGRYHNGGGDGGCFCNVLIPLSWVLR